MIAKSLMAFVLFSLFSFSFNAFCNSTESQLLFSLTSEGKVRLGVINTSKQTLHVEVMDKGNGIVFETAVKAGANYFKLVDFSKLTDGEYDVHLTGLAKSSHFQFNVHGGKIKIVEQNNGISATGVDAPKFTVINNESVIIGFANSKGAIVRVVIEQNGESIFQDQNITDLKIQKKYSLKQLPKGNYEIKLFAGDQTYTYPIEIKKSN